MSNQPPSSSSAHSSLPARPNGPLPSFKPAFNPSSSSWQKTYSPTVSAGPAPPSNFSSQPVSYSNNQGAYDQGQYYQQPSLNYYQQPQSQSQSQATPPNLQNPFPAPGTATGPTPPTDYDPELQAQIAQWQSTYATKDDKPNANYTPLGVARGPIDVGNAVAPGSGVAAVVSGTDGKQKTVIRSGGGKSWQDASLLEWDPTHPRLFIGNLAGEVTDDSLLKAFSRYPSISKARVVRDKRTSKSKGFGFVSFASSDDYFQAAKEMQGKYIGSHPVLIKRSTTEIKASAPHTKGKHDKGAGGHHDRHGGGVQKKLPKKKGGLKLLG